MEKEAKTDFLFNSKNFRAAVCLFATFMGRLGDVKPRTFVYKYMERTRSFHQRCR